MNTPRKPKPSADDHEQRIADFEIELKARDRRIEELKRELDQSRDLVRRMEEHVEDRLGLFDVWIEAFGMTMTDNGTWTWRSFIEDYDKLGDDYCKLARDYNKLIPLIWPQPIGKPPGADEAQRARIIRLREGGRSLRGIAADMKLGLQVVRTVLGQYSQGEDRGKDRTTRKHMQRIGFDRAAETSRKARKRTRDALPRRVNALFKDKAELLKEAKGLK